MNPADPKIHAPTIYRYEYAEPKPNETLEDILRPNHLEQIAKTNGVHAIYTVRAFELDPKFTDDDFTLGRKRGDTIVDHVLDTVIQTDSNLDNAKELLQEALKNTRPHPRRRPPGAVAPPRQSSLKRRRFGIERSTLPPNRCCRTHPYARRGHPRHGQAPLTRIALLLCNYFTIR